MTTEFMINSLLLDKVALACFILAIAILATAIFSKTTLSGKNSRKELLLYKFTLLIGFFVLSIGPIAINLDEIKEVEYKNIKNMLCVSKSHDSREILKKIYNTEDQVIQRYELNKLKNEFYKCNQENELEAVIKLHWEELNRLNK